MIRLVLLVVLLFLFTLPSSSTSPSSPSKTQQGLVINQLAVPNQDLSESKSTELIDQRWQVAAKEWGAWAQVGLQTWGGKVGEWGHAGAEKLKASELASEFGKGFKKLPGVWHASVAAVEKVLPERGRGEMVSEEGRVKESERFGKLGAEMREASREREKEGQAEEAGALRDLEAGRGGAVELVDGEASKRSGEKSWVTKRDPDKRHAVQERSDSCAEVAEPVAKKAKTSIVEPQGKPDGETDNGVARGVQSGLAPQAASFQGDVEIGRAEGRHSERPVVWGVRELENDRQKSRGIPPKRAQDAKATVGQASSEGGQEGELGREIGVDAKRARKSGGDLDGAQVERGPAVRSVEGRSVVEFEEWLQRERLRKAALDESPDVAEISNPGTVSGEKEREGFDVVVLLVGGLCLGCVFWVVRMLSRGSRWVAGCLRGRIDSSQGEETPALVLKEGLVSAEMEGVMGRVSNGLEEVSETYRDRSGQQLGAALGSATGSLMAEALRPLSDPAVPPLCPEELAQKLEAVCTSALGNQVGDIATDALVTELVRSFSRTYRTLTALHSSTPGGSRPRTPAISRRPDKPSGRSPRSPLDREGPSEPVISGRPEKPSGRSPRSPLDREGPSERDDASLSDDGRGLRECASSGKLGVVDTEEILRIRREYGESETSSEEEQSAELSVARNYTVELESVENGSPDAGSSLREAFVEDVVSTGEAANVSAEAFGVVSGAKGGSASGSGAPEIDPRHGESSGPCGPLPGGLSGSLFGGSVEQGVEIHSAGPAMRAGLHDGGVEVHERWSFAGSTARHRKTRRRRGAENGVGRQLLFGGLSEASETGGVLALRSEGGVSLQGAYVERSRSVSVGSRSVEMELAERSVAAQEQAVMNQLVANRLKMRELELQNQQLGLTTEGLALKTEGLELKSESNFVGRQRNELEREKIRLRAASYAEARAGAFARRCADELVAGLVVMVTALVWAGFRYGYPNLQAKLQECRAVQVKHSRSMWGRFGLQAVSDNLAARLQVLGCQVAVTGRLGMGLVVGGFMASLLLRQNVAGSVRVMPSTVLLLVLGGACGYAGKQAVDSVGGSGFCWLVLWEALCALHTLALFPTGFVSSLLYPSADARRPRPLLVSPWVAQLAFHATLVAILPVAAGVLPFLWV